MTRVLFVYPNREGYPIIPLGISVLSGVLKSCGHITDLFDITFMAPDKLDHNAREKTGVVKKVDMSGYWGESKPLDINAEFTKKIKTFNPEIIGFSIVENNYGAARELFKTARANSDAVIIAGGIFPTVSPEFFINDDNVDVVCIGEGERALLKLADSVQNGLEIKDISNLIIKLRKTKEIGELTLSGYYDWEPFALQDWDIFDGRHLFKPFMGKVWKTGFFETSRGCPFNCSYCANHTFQKLFKSNGHYHREKPIDYVIREIEYFKNKYSLELIFFNDENWLMMGAERFQKFCGDYQKFINLPFFIQTRADTLLDEKKVETLKNTGCSTIGIGVESGNPDIRKKILNKKTSDETILKAFENCRKYKIRTTAYFMMGLPDETESDIILSAEFAKKIGADSIALSIFAPYHGTELFDLCVERNYIDKSYNENISVNYSSILNMPQLSKTKLEELYYNFNNMIYGA
ncbi:MAG TPA: radical SAM protein [bacterium]|nr:radical SAM protein [bacterium]